MVESVHLVSCWEPVDPSAGSVRVFRRRPKVLEGHRGGWDATVGKVDAMDEIRFGGEWHPLGDQSAAVVRRAMMSAVKSGETVTVSLTARDGTITVLFWTPGVPVAFRTRTPLQPSG